VSPESPRPNSGASSPSGRSGDFNIRPMGFDEIIRFLQNGQNRYDAYDVKVYR